ncbi:DMT family transporter [Nautilia lithotrophica]
MKNKEKKGLLEMIGATFIWGSTPLMSIYSALPSGVFVFFRVLFAFPFILYFAVKRTGIKEFLKLRPFWPLLISGIALGVNWVFFFLAFNYTDVATAVTIYYVGPIISLLLAGMFLKEKLNKFIIISSVFAFLGVIISNGGISLSKGALLAFLAAVSYGALGFFSKIATMHHRAAAVTAWQILISIFITAPFLFFNDWQLSLQSIIIAFITGVVHTALALFLWYDALNYIKVSLASILQYLDIVFAMILAYLFLGQVPDLNQLIGAVLISLAGMLSTLKEIKK